MGREEESLCSHCCSAAFSCMHHKLCVNYNVHPNETQANQLLRRHDKGRREEIAAAKYTDASSKLSCLVHMCSSACNAHTCRELSVRVCICLLLASSLYEAGPVSCMLVTPLVTFEEHNISARHLEGAQYWKEKTIER
jgi:hypothetical protein